MAFCGLEAETQWKGRQLELQQQLCCGPLQQVCRPLSAFHFGEMHAEHSCTF